MSVEQVLAHTPWGQFWLWPDDLIGRTIIGHNATWADDGRAFWADDATPTAGDGIVNAPDGSFWDGDLLLEHFDAVPHNSSVIDIGAFVGLNAVYLSSRCEVVYAVEPVVLHYDTLVRNLAVNKLMNVYPYWIAAYDKAEKLVMREIDESNRGGTALVPGTVQPFLCVHAGPLDAQIATPAWPVSLIKSDAQGCDLRALRGCRRIISLYRPKIIFEYEADLAALHGDTWADYQAFIEGIGYTMKESSTHKNNYVCVPK